MGKLKLLAYLAFAGTLLISSCAKEDDENTGDARDKFVGSWKCTETENSNPPVTSTFTITISKSSGSSVNIGNINNLGSSVQASALVSGNVMTINTQTIDNFSVSGTGNYSDNRIEMSYKVDNVNHTAVCTKN